MLFFNKLKGYAGNIGMNDPVARVMCVKRVRMKSLAFAIEMADDRRILEKNDVVETPRRDLRSK